MIIKLKDSSKVISDPTSVFEILKAFMKTQDQIDRDKEHFFVFHLDARNKIKILELVSIGSLDSTAAHPREVFTRVIAIRTAGILIAHNHPSGNIEPSIDDRTLTSRLQESAKILGIKFLDHIIVTDKEYYSFKANGLI